MNKTFFKYNVAFYYQSTIVYAAVFIIYVVVRALFVRDTITPIEKDPIIYSMAMVVLISIAALLYNIFNHRRLEISESGVSFVSSKGRKDFPLENIEEIKFKKGRDRVNSSIFKIIRLRIKHRRRPVIIRPNDYENEKRLIELIEELKARIEKANV